MRLLLHIGTHKTGTTSVQMFCARNRGTLRRQGLWYPDYDLIGRQGHFAHHHLAHAIAGLPTSRGNRPEAFEFLSAIRAQAAHDETVLISAEPFWRHVCPPVELSENEYLADGGAKTYWQRRRDYVRALRDAIGDVEVEVAVVLRRQDHCAESLYKERVKGTSYAENFRTYLAAFEHRLRYFDQLTVWAAFFQTMHVLVYEDLAQDGNLVGGFFRSLGLDVSGELAPQHRSNISLNNDLVEFKRRLNATGLSEDELYETVLVMQDDEFQKGLELDTGSTLWESPAGRSAYLERFDGQNARVQQHFLPGRAAGLFPTVEEALPPYTGLTRKTAGSIERRIESIRQRRT